MSESLQQTPFFSAFLRVLKRSGWVLFLLSVFSSFFDQWLNSNMESLLNSQEGTGYKLWLYGGLTISMGMILPLLQMILVLAGSSQRGLLSFLNAKFKQSLIESMRSWGKAMTWSFLLIVPGVVRYIRYLFVVFIVCEDPNYAQGKVEALQTSFRLSRNIWTKLFFIYFVFAILIPSILSTQDELRIITLHPIAGLGFCLLESLLGIVFTLIILRIYRKRALL